MQNWRIVQVLTPNNSKELTQRTPYSGTARKRSSPYDFCPETDTWWGTAQVSLWEKKQHWEGGTLTVLRDREQWRGVAPVTLSKRQGTWRGTALDTLLRDRKHEEERLRWLSANIGNMNRCSTGDCPLGQGTWREVVLLTFPRNRTHDTWPPSSVMGRLDVAWLELNRATEGKLSSDATYHDMAWIAAVRILQQ